MIRFIDCLSTQHDPRLLAPAVLTCLVSILIGFWLYGRARRADPGRSWRWAALSGLTAALGTWSTHFVAMLAYDPIVEVSYAPGLTLLSFLIAAVVMAAGFAASTAARGIAGRAASGALIGSAVAAMHYTGMQALLVPGRLIWDGATVAVSIAAGIGLAAAALSVAGDAANPRRLYGGAVLMVLAIAGLHFTGMSAVTVAFDPALPSSAGMPHGTLAAMVGAGTAAILLAGLACLVVAYRSARAGESRLRDLAEATVEGIAICRDGIVLDANGSFCALVGLPLDAIRGRSLDGFLDQPGLRASSAESGAVLEVGVRRDDGETIPATVVARSLGYGPGRRVFALRDLRGQREAERRIRYLAQHDPLTGLANRATFNEALVLAVARMRRGVPMAVHCLDLDRFKPINDTLGHGAGDRLLATVAVRLRGILRETDLIARLGGDEFAVLQADVTDPAQAGQLADKIVRALGEPYDLDGQQVVIGASVGIALAPQDGMDGETLLRNADMALYRAKKEGRGTFRFFEPGMDARMQERRMLELDLRAALRREEFELHYQPLVEVRSRRVEGFEALLRWRSPTRGMVPPKDFIELAEETGLIVEIGEWVLRRACRDAAGWAGAPRIAVNLSPAQFRSPRLVECVAEAIAQSGLVPERLELEITESLLMADDKGVLGILNSLKAIGATIAMDDFGTGYSSLSYLRKFPFDKIKIDKSFVDEIDHNPEAAAIVRAVTDLGAALGMTTTAEGVETEAQYRRLQQDGCTLAQGFLFSKPRPAGDIPGLLEDMALLEGRLLPAAA